MVRFFRVKKTKNEFKSIVFRVKKRYSNKMKETYIPKKKSIMIYGFDSSGKTKELMKLWKNRESVYRTDNFIMISSVDSLSEMLYNHVSELHVKKYILTLDSEKQKLAHEHKNKQFFKVEVFKHRAKNCVLFVDDIDKFAGKKLEILKELVKDCKVCISSARYEKSINKTIFNLIKNKGFSHVDLSTKASYDVTNYILISALLPFAITGNYMVVMMLLLANRYLDRGVGK